MPITAETLPELISFAILSQLLKYSRISKLTHFKMIESFPGYSFISQAIASYRQPVFLTRNINQSLAVLDSDESKSIDKPLTKRLERSSWKPPSQALIEMHENQTGHRLRINVSGLVPKRQVGSADAHEPAGSTRKKCKVIEVECFVDVRICELSETNHVLSFREEGKLQGRKYDDSSVHFDMTMKNNIIVNLRQLFVARPDGSFGLGEYDMGIRVVLANPQDAKPVTNLVFGCEYPENMVLCIESRYRKLPQLPDSRTILPVVLSDLVSQKDLMNTSKYGLEVNMAWSQRAESSLSVYNGFLRSVIPHTPSPSPRKSQHQTQPPATQSLEEQLSAQYWYLDKLIKFNGLECLFCRGKKQFPVPAKLRDHLQHKHLTMIKMRIEGPVVHFSFEASKPRHRAPSTNREWANLKWVAPSRSALKKKLLDDSSLLSPSPSVSSRSASPRRKASPNKQQARPRVSSQGKRPEWVELEVFPAPMEFNRPPSPHSASGKPLRYFTRLTRRTIEPHEVLPESEDSANDFLLQVSHAIYEDCKDDTDLDLPPGTDSFLIAWNKHLAMECLNGDLFVGDTVLRFIHKERQLLSDKDMRTCLMVRVDELLAADILKQDFYDHIRSMLFDSDFLKSSIQQKNQTAQSERGQNDCLCGVKYVATAAECSDGTTSLDWVLCSGRVSHG
jgi:hypothetical protein